MAILALWVGWARGGPRELAPPSGPISPPDAAAHVQAPTRLEPAARPAFREASPGVELTAPTGVVEVAVSGPAGSPGGIAVLDARTRAPLAWRPLAELDLPTTLRLETLPEGPLLLVHAPSPEAAHDSGYTTIELPAARPLGQPRSASVDTTTATVTLVLEAAVGAHEAIVELRRLDRPRWRVTPVVPVPRGNRWTLPPLGPGRYRVTLRGLVTDTPPTLEFAVPGTTEVTIRTAAADAADPRHPDDRSPTTPGAGQPSSAGR